MPQLDFSTIYSQILWLTISFLLVFISVNKVFAPRVKKLLLHRSTLINNNLKAAETAVLECKRINAELEHIVKNAKLKALILRENAYLEAQTLIETESKKFDKTLLIKENQELEKLSRYKTKSFSKLNEVSKTLSKEILDKLFSLCNVSKEVVN